MSCNGVRTGCASARGAAMPRPRSWPRRRPAGVGRHHRPLPRRARRSGVPQRPHRRAEPHRATALLRTGLHRPRAAAPAAPRPATPARAAPGADAPGPAVRSHPRARGRRPGLRRVLALRPRGPRRSPAGHAVEPVPGGRDPGPVSGRPLVVAYAITGRAGDIGYLQRLAVDPDHHHRGIGSALVLDSLGWARRRARTSSW